MTTDAVTVPSSRWPSSPASPATCATRTRASTPKRTETPGRDQRATASYEVYPYDLNAAVMRDNVTFCSGSIRELMSVVMGPYPLVGMDEPEHKRLRSLVAQAFRQRMLAHWDEDLVVPGRRRDDRQVRRPRRGRARLRVHLPVPGAGDRRDPRPVARGPRVLPPAGARGHQRRGAPGRGDRRERGAARLLRDGRRRRGARTRATTSSASWCRPSSTASGSATRRSSRSCACCCPPAPRRPTAPPAASSTGCSPTPTSSRR